MKPLAAKAAGASAANAHAPRVGVFRRWLGPLHFSGVFWARFGFWVSTRTPDWILRPTAWVCARGAYALLPGVRRSLLWNRRLVQGPASRRVERRRVLESFDTFSWCLAERWERFEPERRFEVEFEGVEHWEAATADGAGVLLVTAHVGMWEAASRLPATEFRRQVHLVREPELDAGCQAFLEGLLARDGTAEYVTHFANDPTLGVALLNAVRDGHMVALQGDRPRAGGRTLGVRLFGAPFELPDGPAVLARATRRPLLPVFALREGRRRYRVVFGEPVAAARTPDRAADHQGVADAFAAVLEGVIARAPGQWFKFGGKEG